MELLQQTKDAMRIRHDKLNDLLGTDIEAAAMDMSIAGVEPWQKDESGEYILTAGKRTLKENELIKKAAELYAKMIHDFEGKGAMYGAAYEKLRNAMASCGDYHE